MLASIGLEVFVLLLLILANGVLAGVEIAMVSARKTLLRQRAESGDRGAQAALDLLDEPNRFLSTVQVGITLIGVLTGAIGGATLAREIAPFLAPLPLVGGSAQAISIGLVVVLTTYFTLVLGELTPKRLALGNAEGIAAALARPMQGLATLTAPAVKLLSFSTRVMVMLLGGERSAGQEITEEELRLLIEEGAQSGALEATESDLVDRALRLDDIPITQLMTPRPEIVWLDLSDPPDQLVERMLNSAHSTFLVCDETIDDVQGVVFVRQLWEQQAAGQPFDLKAAMRTPIFIPENARANLALEKMRQAGMRVILVMDEYGGVEGLVTLNDVLEGLVGDIPLPGEAPAPTATRRSDGSWLVDAGLPVEAFKEQFGLMSLPREEQDRYQTVGGFVLSMLRRIPQETDSFAVSGLQVEVLDMDEHRVDKVLVTAAAEEDGNSSS